MSSDPGSEPKKLRGLSKEERARSNFKDPNRFYCPHPNCDRSFGELWRLKVHYRAAPDIRGSGRERGHGGELDHCPKCGQELLVGKHHVGCVSGRAAPRQAAKRMGTDDGDGMAAEGDYSDVSRRDVVRNVNGTSYRHQEPARKRASYDDEDYQPGYDADDAGQAPYPSAGRYKRRRSARPAASQHAQQQAQQPQHQPHRYSYPSAAWPQRAYDKRQDGGQLRQQQYHPPEYQQQQSMPSGGGTAYEALQELYAARAGQPTAASAAHALYSASLPVPVIKPAPPTNQDDFIMQCVRGQAAQATLRPANGRDPAISRPQAANGALAGPENLKHEPGEARPAFQALAAGSQFAHDPSDVAQRVAVAVAAARQVGQDQRYMQAGALPGQMPWIGGAGSTAVADHLARLLAMAGLPARAAMAAIPQQASALQQEAAAAPGYQLVLQQHHLQQPPVHKPQPMAQQPRSQAPQHAQQQSEPEQSAGGLDDPGVSAPQEGSAAPAGQGMAGPARTPRWPGLPKQVQARAGSLVTKPLLPLPAAAADGQSEQGGLRRVKSAGELGQAVKEAEQSADAVALTKKAHSLPASSDAAVQVVMDQAVSGALTDAPPEAQVRPAEEQQVAAIQPHSHRWGNIAAQERQHQPSPPPDAAALARAQVVRQQALDAQARAYEAALRAEEATVRAAEVTRRKHAAHHAQQAQQEAQQAERGQYRHRQYQADNDDDDDIGYGKLDAYGQPAHYGLSAEHSRLLASLSARGPTPPPLLPMRPPAQHAPYQPPQPHHHHHYNQAAGGMGQYLGSQHAPTDIPSSFGPGRPDVTARSQLVARSSASSLPGSSQQQGSRGGVPRGHQPGQHAQHEPMHRSSQQQRPPQPHPSHQRSLQPGQQQGHAVPRAYHDQEPWQQQESDALFRPPVRRKRSSITRAPHKYSRGAGNMQAVAPPSDDEVALLEELARQACSQPNTAGSGQSDSQRTRSDPNLSPACSSRQDGRHGHAVADSVSADLSISDSDDATGGQQRDAGHRTAAASAAQSAPQNLDRLAASAAQSAPQNMDRAAAPQVAGPEGKNASGNVQGAAGLQHRQQAYGQQHKHGAAAADRGAVQAPQPAAFPPVPVQDHQRVSQQQPRSHEHQAPQQGPHFSRGAGVPQAEGGSAQRMQRFWHSMTALPAHNAGRAAPEGQAADSSNERASSHTNAQELPPEGQGTAMSAVTLDAPQQPPSHKVPPVYTAAQDVQHKQQVLVQETAAPPDVQWPAAGGQPSSAATEGRAADPGKPLPASSEPVQHPAEGGPAQARDISNSRGPADAAQQANLDRSIGLESEPEERIPSTDNPAQI